MKYKAILFDMDGTLLDTVSGVTLAMNKTFEHFGYDVRFTNSDGKYYIGAGNAEFARRALAHANIFDMDLMKFREVFLANYSVYQKNGTQPFPGFEPVLNNLKKSGYIVGICSNKPQKLLNQVVEQMFPCFKFDIIFGQHEGVPCKPEPMMFEMVKQELNLSEKEILYVGDSEVDYDFTRNAGCDCMMMTHGYGMYEKDFVKKCKFVCSGPEDIIDKLK